MSEIKQVWGIIKDYQCADLKMVQDPALAVFQHQQAKIEKLENELSTTKQVLGNVIDMEVAKVDNLKAQLNNMEACYIEKKKQIEEKDKRIKELERSCISYKNQRDDYAQKLMVKSVHYSSIQEELAKLKDRLELAHHLATQSTWSSLKQLKKVVKALRGEE